MLSSQRWVGYAVAVLATAAVGAGRYAFDRAFGAAPHFLLPFVVPVLLAAWFGGGGPGLFATALNAAVAVALFGGPTHGPGAGAEADRLRVALLVGVGLFVSAVCGRFHRFRDGAEAAAAQSALRQRELQAEVAQRREVERRLLDSQSLVRLVTDHVPVLLAHCDRELRHTFVNRAYAEWVGSDAPAVVGRTIPDVLGAAAYDRISGHLAAALGGATVEFEADVPHPTAGPRRVHCTYRPARAAGGEVSGLVAAVQDVTARVRADAALRESEERYRVLTDALPHMVWAMRPDLALDYLNSRASEFTGLTVEQVNAAGWGELVHPDDLPGMLAAVSGPLERGEPHDAEYRFRHRTGEYRWVASRAVPVRAADGAVVRWVGSTSDVHDRRVAEGRLRASERRYRALVRATPQVVWTAGGAEDEGAGWWAELTGQPPGESAGWGWLEAVHPDDRARVRAAWTDAYAARTLYDAEYRVRTRSGAYRHFAARGVPLTDGAGNLEEWVGTLADVHDRTVAQAELREWGAALERRVEERTAALQESAAFSRGVLDALPAHIAVLDRAGLITAVNRAWERYAEEHPASGGVAARTGAGVSYLGVCDDSAARGCAEAAAAAAAIRRVLAGGAPGPALQYACHAPDEPRWFSMSVSPLPAAGGAVVAHTDITARKVAEEAVRASEERFQAFMAHAPIAAWVVDSQSRFLYVSPGFDRLLNLAPGTSVGRSSADLFPPEIAAQHLKNNVLVGTTGRVLAEEEPFVHPDGSPGVAVVVKFPMLGPSGEPLVGGVAIDITARKVAEEAVRESEERFRNAFDHAPIGMALVGPDGRWLRVNRSLCDMLGYSEAELLATDFQTTTHPDDLGAHLESVRRVLAGTLLTYQMEKRYVHRQGHAVPVLLSASLVRDRGGRPLYFVSQIKDITQRKEAERALAANDALLRQFIQHSPAAIAMFDREVRYLQASDRWLADYRLGGRDLIGRSHYEVFPDIPERWKAVHRRVLAGAVEGCAEDPFPRADGTTEWLQWECRPWHAADGAVGGLIMFTQVITARKRADAALRASEERLRMALRGAEAGVWECALPGWASYWSAEYRDLYGFTADEEARVEKWRARVHPDDLPRVESNLAAMAEPGRDAWQQEFRLVVPERGVRWILDFVRVIRGPDGRPTGVGGVNIDITARKRSEELVLASLREKEVLLKEIHHRVKNNLQIVSALLDLQSGHTADPAALGMFQESRGRVKSMALIHERLYRSQDMARVDFTEYVRQLAEDLYRTYKVSDDDIRLELDVAVPPLPIDVAIPCGLLLNELMSNCFKHAFKEAAAGRIRVSFRPDGDDHVLVVADDGAGLPAGTDFRDTTSFGLQLVNTLADQLGGGVALAAGPGTTFVVRFPRPGRNTQEALP